MRKKLANIQLNWQSDWQQQSIPFTKSTNETINWVLLFVRHEIYNENLCKCIETDFMYFSWDFSCAVHSSPKSDELVPLINLIRMLTTERVNHLQPLWFSLSSSFLLFVMVFVSLFWCFFSLDLLLCCLTLLYIISSRIHFSTQVFRCGFFSLRNSFDFIATFYSPCINRNISMPNETSNFTKSHSII